jgi:hypothetical protein
LPFLIQRGRQRALPASAVRPVFRTYS